MLNLAASLAGGSHPVFLDGESLPRRDFVAAIRRALTPGSLLAGNVSTSAASSHVACSRTTPVRRWSAATWLTRAPREVRRPGLLVPLRDRRRPWRPWLPEFIPPFNGYGSPFAVSRADFERANGFDRRFVGPARRTRGSRAPPSRWAQVRLGRPSSTLVHVWHNPRVDRARLNAPLLVKRERAIG